MPGIFIQGADTNISDQEFIPECPICQCEIGPPNDTDISELPIGLSCGHYIGHHCLATHLQSQWNHAQPSTCPHCRHAVAEEHRTAITRMLPPKPARPQGITGTTAVETTRSQFTIGHTTTDELAPFIRIYHPYESLFETIQGIPMAAYRFLSPAERVPLLNDAPSELAVPIALLLSVEVSEIDEVAHFGRSYNTLTREAGDAASDGITMRDIFAAVGVLPGRTATNVEFAEQIWQREALMRMARAALGATNRLVLQQNMPYNEISARVVHGVCDRIDHQAELDAVEGPPRMAMPGSSRSHPASDSRNGFPPSPPIPLALRTSPSDAAARRIVILDLALSAFTDLLQPLRESREPQPNEFPIRTLYAPVEIESIAIGISNTGILRAEGVSGPATVATIQQQLNELGTQPGPGVDHNVHEHHRAILEGLLETLMRPVHRNIIFNGTTTYQHGVNYFAGGTPRHGDPPEELIDTDLRRRISNTTARAFELASLQQAQGDEDDDDFGRDQRDDVINTTPADSLQTQWIQHEYTDSELAEIFALLQFVNSETEALDVYQPVEQFMRHEHSAVDPPSPYRLRIREIIFRPIFRRRRDRNEARDRDLADALDVHREEGRAQDAILTAMTGRVVRPGEVRRPTPTLAEARERFWEALRPTPTPMPTHAGLSRPRVRVREVEPDAGDNELFTEDEIGFHEYTMPDIQALRPLEGTARRRQPEPVLVDEDDFPETLQDIRFPRSRQQDGITGDAQRESAPDDTSTLYDIQPPLGSRFSDYSSSDDDEMEDSEVHEVSLTSLTFANFSEALMAHTGQALSPQAAYLRTNVPAQDRARLFVRMNGLYSALGHGDGHARNETTLSELEGFARQIVRESGHARYDEARAFLNLLERVVEELGNASADNRHASLRALRQQQTDATSPASAAYSDSTLDLTPFAFGLATGRITRFSHSILDEADMNRQVRYIHDHFTREQIAQIDDLLQRMLVGLYGGGVRTLRHYMTTFDESGSTEQARELRRLIYGFTSEFDVANAMAQGGGVPFQPIQALPLPPSVQNTMNTADTILTNNLTIRAFGLAALLARYSDLDDQGRPSRLHTQVEFIRSHWSRSRAQEIHDLLTRMEPTRHSTVENVDGERTLRSYLANEAGEDYERAVNVRRLQGWIREPDLAGSHDETRESPVRREDDADMVDTGVQVDVQALEQHQGNTNAVSPATAVAIISNGARNTNADTLRIATPPPLGALDLTPRAFALAAHATSPSELDAIDHDSQLHQQVEYIRRTWTHTRILAIDDLLRTMTDGLNGAQERPIRVYLSAGPEDEWFPEDSRDLRRLIYSHTDESDIGDTPVGHTGAFL